MNVQRELKVIIELTEDESVAIKDFLYCYHRDLNSSAHAYPPQSQEEMVSSGHVSKFAQQLKTVSK